MSMYKRLRKYLYACKIFIRQKHDTYDSFKLPFFTLARLLQIKKDFLSIKKYLKISPIKTLSPPDIFTNQIFQIGYFKLRSY